MGGEWITAILGAGFEEYAKRDFTLTAQAIHILGIEVGIASVATHRPLSLTSHSHSKANLLQGVFLDSIKEGVSSQAQEASRMGAVALGSPEGLADEPPFQLIQLQATVG